MTPGTFEDRLDALKRAAALRNTLYLERCLMSDNENQEWRWERFNVQLRIVAAANRYGDFVIAGSRHFCVTMNGVMDAIGMDVLHAYAGGPDNEEQGFIDQYGTFHSREAAAQIAIAAGQVKAENLRGNQLFSEDIW